MSLRIAFDLDGVLADMESELVRQAEILFGEPMTRRLQERAAEAAEASRAAADARRRRRIDGRRSRLRPAGRRSST